MLAMKELMRSKVKAAKVEIHGEVRVDAVLNKYSYLLDEWMK